MTLYIHPVSTRFSHRVSAEVVDAKQLTSLMHDVIELSFINMWSSTGKATLSARNTYADATTGRKALNHLLPV